MRQMKEGIKHAHMRVAEIYSQLSYCERLKVGCIIVKDGRIISIGYNGTPSGWVNVCEVNNVTKKEVLHAETNAIAKLAKSQESGDGSSMFITHAPCIECAKLIYQSGIDHVYYKELYRSYDGIDFLIQCNILVEKI